jgi:septum formation protein
VAPGRRIFRRGSVESRVEFRELAAEEIRSYVATGEPLDKAGAYGIQGAGSDFVRSLVGSRSNVVGLPLEAVADALRAAGLWIEHAKR